jgi:hypothetical protein
LSKRAIGKGMKDEATPERPNQHPVKRLARHVSRTRLVMALLLIIAIPIFISLANKAVHENAAAIMQGLGR